MYGSRREVEGYGGDGSGVRQRGGGEAWLCCSGITLRGQGPLVIKIIEVINIQGESIKKSSTK